MKRLKALSYSLLLPPPLRRVRTGKLTVAKLVKTLPAFMEPTFTKAHR